MYSCFAFRKRDVTEAKNWLSNVYPTPVGGAKPEHTEELETHLTPLFKRGGLMSAPFRDIPVRGGVIVGLFSA